KRIRLAELAEELQCEAFSYNVYDSTQEVLVEATRDGRHAPSGFADRGCGDLAYYDEPFAGDEHAQAYFRLLDAMSWLGAQTDPDARSIIRALVANPYPGIRSSPTPLDIASGFARVFGDAAGVEDNGVLVENIIGGLPFERPGWRLHYAQRLT